MARSKIRRRAKSWSDLIDRDVPTHWNIDEALSSGFDKSRESLSQIFPRSDYEDLHKKYKDLEKKCEVLQKDKEDLEKKNKALQSAEAKLEAKLELRELFNKAKKEVDVGLMEEARLQQANGEFPTDIVLKPTYMGTTAATVKEKANESTKETKFYHLRKVAVEFTPQSPSLKRWWNPGMGEMYFTLCKSVAQWNNVDFHPAIEGVRRCVCKNKAKNGMYKVDDVDLGPLVLELLHTK